MTALPPTHQLDVSMVSDRGHGCKDGSFSAPVMKNLLNRHNFDLRTLATVSIAIVSWASAFAGIRAAPGAYSPAHIALLRYGTASVALAVYAAITRNLHLLNTHYSLLVSYTTFTLPLCIWMLKGFFDGIPRELEEASLIDGCSNSP